MARELLAALSLSVAVLVKCQFIIMVIFNDNQGRSVSSNQCHHSPEASFVAKGLSTG